MRRAQAVMVLLTVFAVALAGCAGARETTKTPTVKPAAKAEACSSEAALPKELSTPGGVVVFGEAHGVKELPWFFGEAVCSTANTGLPVGVGLEISAAEQARVDAFLASSGQPSDVELLLQGPFWTSKDQDGRASQARVELLERLRRLRAAGLPVQVFLFDPIPGDGVARRDTQMAQNIAEQARSHPDELTMVLVGDFHAMKKKGASWDKDWVSMGWQLAESGLPLHSIGRSTPEGTVWTCDMSGSCGPATAPAYHPIPDGPTSGIELLATPTRQGYDGIYTVSTLTMSPPAAQAYQSTK